jgi:hypothetical protein
MMAVCRRCRGRGSDRRLASYASVHSGMCGGVLGFRKREGEVEVEQALAGVVERCRGGQWLNDDWGCRVAVVREREEGEI